MPQAEITNMDSETSQLNHGHLHNPMVDPTVLPGELSALKILIQQRVEIMNTKAISLFLLRFSTGIYLCLWGIDKLTNAAHSVSLSDRFYGGLLSAETIVPAIGGIQVIVGLLVILGLMRKISYMAQLVWYVIGIVPIIGYIIDPFALFLVDTARLTWFPSTTLLFASLVIIIFKEFDTISIDHKRGK